MAFGWNTIEVDGHDLCAIDNAIELAKRTKGKPTVILCATTKGKGVSYMENEASWHGTPPNYEQHLNAIAELKR
jgi:transketolase